MNKQYNYEYKKIDVPKEIIEKSKITMAKIGCRTITSYVSMALIDYNKKICEIENSN